MSLTKLIVPTCTQMLRALSGWLTKAQDQMSSSDAQALLSARLATDMFPLATQVRFACVQAQEAMFRLRGLLRNNLKNRRRILPTLTMLEGFSEIRAQ